MTLHRGMIAVAACAVYMALLRVESLTAPLAIVTGPIVGSVCHRALGGRGILGGMAGGIASFWGLGACLYLRAYLNPQPNTVDYIGPFYSFLALGLIGAAVGLVVGLAIWGLIRCAQLDSIAHGSTSPTEAD